MWLYYSICFIVINPPALGGMWLGQQIRSRLSVEQFRQAVFWALLLTGLYTVATRLL